MRLRHVTVRAMPCFFLPSHDVYVLERSKSSESVDDVRSRDLSETIPRFLDDELEKAVRVRMMDDSSSRLSRRWPTAK